MKAFDLGVRDLERRLGHGADCHAHRGGSLRYRIRAKGHAPKPARRETGRQFASGTLRRMKTIDWESLAARLPAALSMRLKPGQIFEDPVILALCVSTVIFALVGLVLLFES
jgi:hypothetical protein